MRRPKAKASRMSREEMSGAIESIRRGYSDFVAGGTSSGSEDPKGFANHHAAGRAALNHLEHLLDLTEGGEATEAEFDDALRRARDAVSADREKDSADDGPDHDGDDA